MAAVSRKNELKVEVTLSKTLKNGEKNIFYADSGMDLKGEKRRIDTSQFDRDQKELGKSLSAHYTNPV